MMIGPTDAGAVSVVRSRTSAGPSGGAASVVRSRTSLGERSNVSSVMTTGRGGSGRIAMRTSWAFARIARRARHSRRRGQRARGERAVARLERGILQRRRERAARGEMRLREGELAASFFEGRPASSAEPGAGQRAS